MWVLEHPGKKKGFSRMAIGFHLLLFFLQNFQLSTVQFDSLSGCCRELLQQYKIDKQTGSYNHLRPRTMVEHMQDVVGHLMNIQGALPRPSHGALAAYSPPRVPPAGHARETYASQLAEHQRAFQQLQDAAAQEESHAEAEGVPQLNVECDPDIVAC